VGDNKQSVERRGGEEIHALQQGPSLLPSVPQYAIVTHQFRMRDNNHTRVCRL